MRVLTLGTRVLLMVAGIAGAGFLLTIAAVTYRAGLLQKQQAFATTDEMAQKNAEIIKSRIDLGMLTARTLANTLEGIKAQGNPSRVEANAALRGILEGNKGILSLSTCWEPNAFDGRDKDFVGKPVHDKSGRFIPYWNRGTGTQLLSEPLVDYEKPGDGDWYLLARNSGLETIVEPYFYPIAGKQVLMTTVTVPVRRNDKVLGVTTVDMALASFQEVVSAIHPYEIGYASIVSNKGVYVADAEPAQINKDLGTSAAMQEAKAAIRAGQLLRVQTFDEHLKTEVYRVYVPIAVGKSSTPWSFVITVPVDRVLAGVAETRNVALLLGLISISAMVTW